MNVPFPNPRMTQYLLWNARNYFNDAEEYIRLLDTFEEISIWTIFDMVYPIFLILITIVTKKGPDIFSLLGLHKTIVIWKSYFTFLSLERHFREWKAIVNAVGGPFISTNDVRYMPYVYADGMQRIHTKTFSSVKRRPITIPSLPTTISIF